MVFRNCLGYSIFNFSSLISIWLEITLESLRKTIETLFFTYSYELQKKNEENFWKEKTLINLLRNFFLFITRRKTSELNNLKLFQRNMEMEVSLETEIEQSSFMYLDDFLANGEKCWQFMGFDEAQIVRFVVWKNQKHVKYHLVTFVLESTKLKRKTHKVKT